MFTYDTVEYDNDQYASLPSLPDLTLVDGKYAVIPWMKQYSWTWLADTIYGDKSKSVDLMLLNGVIDPFQDMEGRVIKVSIPSRSQ